MRFVLQWRSPLSQVAAFVVKGAGVVKMRALQVVQVTLGIAETFDSFFADNLIDPNAISDEFAAMVPPDYAASYDPSGGGIVKENRFVRNMASVLGIDPARIAVVNIVPGSRRRRRAMAVAAAAGEGHEWRRYLAADNATDDDDGDDGVDLDWTVASTDPCDGVVCVHGLCNSGGTCDCDADWCGAKCNTTLASLNATELVPTPSPTVGNSTNGTEVSATSNTTESAYSELLSVASTLTSAASGGYFDTGCEFGCRRR